MRSWLETVRELPPLALGSVAIGLLLSVVLPVGYLENTPGGGLDWVTSERVPPSRTASLGEDGEVQLRGGRLRETEPNAAGFRLFRVSATLAIVPPENPPRRATCTMRVPTGTLVVQTQGSRASYPRPSEKGLSDQEVPSEVVVNFHAKGGELVRVGLTDAFQRFVGGSNSTLEWGEYEPGHQTFIWRISDPEPGQLVNLRFATFWRTTGRPRARLTCQVGEGEGAATVRTAAASSEPPTATAAE